MLADTPGNPDIPKNPDTPVDPRTDRPGLRAALKQSASALKEEGIPFAVAGGYALWVHGAPESEHDVDLAIEDARVEQAVDCLKRAGFEIERPPEDWLFKAYFDGAMVDVLHRLHGEPVDIDTLAAAQEQEVLGLRIPVLPAEHVVIGKLLAMTERYCDFTGMLPVVRAVREQLDWDRVAEQVQGNHFAETFLDLTRRLGISPTTSDGAAPSSAPE